MTAKTCVTSTLLTLLASGLAQAADPVAHREARLMAHSNLCLGASSAPGAGERMATRTCDGFGLHLWQVPPRGFAGELRLGGLCLDSGADQEGTPARLQSCDGRAGQRWHH